MHGTTNPKKVFQSDVKISLDTLIVCIKLFMKICFIRTLVS